jgi:hypothetical protein
MELADVIGEHKVVAYGTHCFEPYESPQMFEAKNQDLGTLVIAPTQLIVGGETIRILRVSKFPGHEALVLHLEGAAEGDNCTLSVGGPYAPQRRSLNLLRRMRQSSYFFDAPVKRRTPLN